MGPAARKRFVVAVTAAPLGLAATRGHPDSSPSATVAAGRTPLVVAERMAAPSRGQARQLSGRSGRGQAGGSAGRALERQLTNGAAVADAGRATDSTSSNARRHDVIRVLGTREVSYGTRRTRRHQGNQSRTGSHGAGRGRVGRWRSPSPGTGPTLLWLGVDIALPKPDRRAHRSSPSRRIHAFGEAERGPASRTGVRQAPVLDAALTQRMVASPGADSRAQPWSARRSWPSSSASY